MGLQRRLEFGRERAAVARIVEPTVMHHDAVVDEPLREVAHRGQEDRDARLGGPDVGRLLGDLGHPDGIARWIEAFEGGGVAVELIAENDDEVAQPVGR